MKLVLLVSKETLNNTNWPVNSVPQTKHEQNKAYKLNMSKIKPKYQYTATAYNV